MNDVDRDYIFYVKTQCACAAAREDGAGPCDGPIHAHHAGVVGKGMGLKPPDSTCVPLCGRHHLVGWHLGGPPFTGWSSEQRTLWAVQTIAATQTGYAAWRRALDAGLF